MSEKDRNETDAAPTNDSEENSKERKLSPQQEFSQSDRSRRLSQQVMDALKEGNREDEEMRKEYGSSSARDR